MASRQRPKVKVKIIGNDFNVMSMFKRANRSVEYTPMVNDVHSEPDLVVFTGGSDVCPEFYGEEILPVSAFDRERDKQEEFIFNRYKSKPKVGICRGGQFLNVKSGGKMWQHVSGHSRGHDMTNLLPFPGWKMGDTFRVTSSHHQMMIAGQDGEVLGCVYDKKTNKGIGTEWTTPVKGREPPRFDTEVVWYRGTNSLCFQPHPEYLTQDQTEKYFFDLLDHFWFAD